VGEAGAEALGHDVVGIAEEARPVANGRAEAELVVHSLSVAGEDHLSR